MPEINGNVRPQMHRKYEACITSLGRTSGDIVKKSLVNNTFIAHAEPLDTLNSVLLQKSQTHLGSPRMSSLPCTEDGRPAPQLLNASIEKKAKATIKFVLARYDLELMTSECSSLQTSDSTVSFCDRSCYLKKPHGN
ncbi:hypothetical protein NPIL_693011 [Nephila pilipes]|uniref:Uncharacterized protein n=1 Tax=Nephila pilipes TaxID=299642 RepID=A0A8X6UKA1_NEPPI|nr:hypothetical protein NPIL_693011 [Nephila pilipes]